MNNLSSIKNAGEPMSESEIKNSPLAGVYAEIAGVKMILRAILEGGFRDSLEIALL